MNIEWLFFFVFQVINTMNMDQTVNWGWEYVFKIIVVLDIGDPWSMNESVDVILDTFSNSLIFYNFVLGSLVQISIITFA